MNLEKFNALSMPVTMGTIAIITLVGSFWNIQQLLLFGLSFILTVYGIYEYKAYTKHEKTNSVSKKPIHTHPDISGGK